MGLIVILTADEWNFETGEVTADITLKAKWEREVEHTWDAGTITTAAACGRAGVKTLTCSGCGETKTEAIAATGVHKWDEGTVTKEATCTSCGARM